MKLLSIFMVVVICMPALSIATPDSAIAGPYNVSFDLGLPKTAYKVNVTESAEGGLLGNYTVNIKYNVGISRMAMISIMEGRPMLLPEEIEAIPSILFSAFGGLKNTNTSAIEIDGTDGTLTTGDGSLLGLKIKYNQAMYSPSNDTGVLIVSTYPWNEGTRQLLDSVHIEKINTTS
jgi:hypothetical protein